MDKNYRPVPEIIGLLGIMILILAGCAHFRQTVSDQTKPPSAAQAGFEEATPKKVILWQDRRPEWLDGASRRYPSKQYLLGVGEGPDRQTAEDQARAEIAKIFYSRIESQNRTYQSYLQTDSGAKLKTTEQIDIQDITQVSTRKVLAGVHIAEIFTETRPKQKFYALAVLDRAQSQQILQTKIKDLDKGIQESLRDAQAQVDQLLKIKYLNMGLEKLILRDVYDTELRIVNPAGHGIESAVSIAEVRKELIGILLRDFQIALTVEGNRAVQIRQILVEALNQLGFSVAGDHQKASVLVRGRIEFKPSGQQASEWKFVRWSSYFDLVDLQSGAIFGSVHKNGKEGHLTYMQAEERAVRKLRQGLVADIAKDLKGYILSAPQPPQASQ